MLDQLRVLAQEMLDNPPLDMRAEPYSEPREMAEAFQALDGWLSKGGFLPRDWAFKTSPAAGCPLHDDEEDCED